MKDVFCGEETVEGMRKSVQTTVQTTRVQTS
jgi:hypothetical protein